MLNLESLDDLKVALCPSWPPWTYIWQCCKSIVANIIAHLPTFPSKVQTSRGTRISFICPRKQTYSGGGLGEREREES